MTDNTTRERLVEAIHPSEIIQDELDARGWSWRDLANRMGGSCVENMLVLDLYRKIGPSNPAARLGQDTADQIATAFNVSSSFFFNLEELWLAQHDAAARADGGGL